MGGGGPGGCKPRCRWPPVARWPCRSVRRGAESGGGGNPGVRLLSGPNLPNHEPYWARGGAEGLVAPSVGGWHGLELIETPRDRLPISDVGPLAARDVCPHSTAAEAAGADRGGAGRTSCRLTQGLQLPAATPRAPVGITRDRTAKSGHAPILQAHRPVGYFQCHLVWIGMEERRRAPVGAPGLPRVQFEARRRPTDVLMQACVSGRKLAIGDTCHPRHGGPAGGNGPPLRVLLTPARLALPALLCLGGAHRREGVLVGMWLHDSEPRRSSHCPAMGRTSRQTAPGRRWPAHWSGAVRSRGREAGR